MLKVAYHRPMNSPWVMRRSLGTDELEYCHGGKQGGKTIEELGDEPQVGVVDMVIIKGIELLVWKLTVQIVIQVRHPSDS